MDGVIIRIGLVLVGAILIVYSFWMHSIKRITINFAVIWELFGVCLVLIGAIPVFSSWTRYMAPGTGIAFFCVGSVLLFEAVQLSQTISQLTLKNRELAMQVALLNQENEQIMNKLEYITKALEDADEKDSLRH